MTRTDFDDTYDGQGNRLSRVSRVVSDYDDLKDGTPIRIGQAYAGLRTWATDAQAAFDTWPTKTAAQKDATQREVIRRFGILCDRLADLLLHQNLDN